MKYDYNGPEIVSELVLNVGCRGKGKIKQKQKISVRCSKCFNVKETTYYGHVYNRLKSKFDKYLCHSCSNSINMSSYNKSNVGIKLEDRLGIEKAKNLKEKLRQHAIKTNAKDRLWDYTGRSWESVRGKEKSDKDKENLRKNNSLVPRYGPDNHQWGKPAHKLSGKGTKGYYNGIYFRSLMEASFIIKYLEPRNIIFENGELKKYAIPYVHDGIDRNYFCDFVSNGIFYEIKPKALHYNARNLSKWKYAKDWCEEKGYVFKVFSEYDYEKLSQEEIDNLKECGKLVLI